MKSTSASDGATAAASLAASAALVESARGVAIAPHAIDIACLKPHDREAAQYGLVMRPGLDDPLPQGFGVRIVDHRLVDAAEIRKAGVALQVGDFGVGAGQFRLQFRVITGLAGEAVDVFERGAD